MNRVLVTGAGGFIGGCLVERLLQMGCVVRASMRKRMSRGLWSGDADIVVADLDNAAGIDAAVAGNDTVFHLAGKVHQVLETSDERDESYYGVNVEGTRNVLEAAIRHGVQRFVFFSSAKAMGEDAPTCLCESDEARPATPYGRSKLAAEELVLEYGRRSGLHVVCLRLPLVYGVGNKGNLVRMIAAIDRGLFPPLPRAYNRRSMVHVSNVIDAAILAATSLRGAGQRYIVTDEVPYSTRKIYEWVCEALGKRVPGWGVPMIVLRTLGKIGDGLGRVQQKRFMFDSNALEKLMGSAWYSSERISTELGYCPLVSLRDALPELVAWYRKVYT